MQLVVIPFSCWSVCSVSDQYEGFLFGPASPPDAPPDIFSVVPQKQRSCLYPQRGEGSCAGDCCLPSPASRSTRPNALQRRTPRTTNDVRAVASQTTGWGVT